MSSFLGDPALRLLARRKLRAAGRSFRRRLRTWRGLVFTLVGLAFFVLWIGTLFLPTWQRPELGDPADLRAGARVGAFLLAMLSLSSAFSHRGLFLPAEEIQRLLAAPVSRRDLVRYRLQASLGRALVSGLVVGIAVMRRMPHPLYAFLGCLVAMLTLPILNQLVAIVSGGLEKRWTRVLAHLRAPLVVAVVAGVVLLLSDLGDQVPGIAEVDPRGVLDAPLVERLTAPFAPWALMVTADDLPSFLGWAAVCLGVALFLFEATVRLPVDFRELSLETSASVAARLRRVRRGGGVAAGDASRSLAGLRVPWLFGRTPFGALAWRKSAGILRKAKGTLWVSVLVLFFLTLMGGRSAERMPLIAVLGTFYLASGLRFDFRDDLDRMAVVKAWPISAPRAFAATLVPEVCLVAALVMTALALHAAVVGSLSPWFWAALALQPPFVFAWVAVDNAVFLFAPVRFVAGQEGTLQNAGRGMVLLFLRALVLLGVGVVAAGPALLFTWLATNRLGWTQAAAFPLAVGIAGGMLAVCDLCLVLIGGTLLRRFDVARDRG